MGDVIRGLLVLLVMLGAVLFAVAMPPAVVPSSAPEV